jgi:hypothetical protein
MGCLGHVIAVGVRHHVTQLGDARRFILQEESDRKSTENNWLRAHHGCHRDLKRSRHKLHHLSRPSGKRNRGNMDLAERPLVGGYAVWRSSSSVRRIVQHMT